MKVESNNVVIDAISLYWKIAKHVGPKDRDDIFYTSFAVSLLTVTQLTLVVFVAGSLGSSIIDRVSSGLVTALILVLAAILAGVNSMIISQTSMTSNVLCTRPMVASLRKSLW